MDEFVDIYGDDDDLLEDTGNKDNDGILAEAVLCSDPSHDHYGDTSGLPDDLKNLIKIFPITALSHNLTDGASKPRALEEEQIAIIATLIDIVGKERFDNILAASEHYRRFKTWNSVAEVYAEVLGSNLIAHFNIGDETENATVYTVIRSHLETASAIATFNRDLHRKVLDTEYPDFDATLIENMYSFHAWQRSSGRFLTELKTSVETILNGISQIFEGKEPPAPPPHNERVTAL